MKKTFIALSITSIFSATASGASNDAINDLKERVNVHQETINGIIDVSSENTNDITKAKIDIKSNTQAVNKVKEDIVNSRNEIMHNTNDITKNMNDIIKVNERVDLHQETIDGIIDVSAGNTQDITKNKFEIKANTQSIKQAEETGAREVAKLESSLEGVNKGIRLDGEKAYNSLRAEGGREVAKLESVTNALDKKMNLMEKDGTKYVEEKADAAVAKSATQLYDAGAREVAKLESSLEGVNKGIRLDGEKAYNSLRAEGGREVAKLESVTNALDKKMNLMEKDGTKYVEEKADAAVAKSATQLYDAGAREVAKLESSLEGVNKGIRLDGEKAYNSLRAEGGREVAKLESVTNALDKKMNLMEKDGTKYVEEKADAAVAKSATQLYDAGAREVAKLESSLEGVNKGIRLDAEKAYNDASKNIVTEATKAESAIKSEFAKVRDEIKQSSADGGIAADSIKKELRAEATKEYSKVEKSVTAAANDIEKTYNQDKADMSSQIASLQAQIDDLRNNGGDSNSRTSEESDRNKAKIDDVHNRIDHEIANIDKASREAINEFYKDGKEYIDGRMDKQDERISGLEESMKKMGNKMLQLEERMDGVVATSHAVTNARPVLSAVGEYGVGVGIGAAGSKQALAFGGAMQMTENWSASTTVNYETKGKHSKGQFSAGVGAQYKF
ncbi:YadA-like family protein [Vibrio alfacsensis]|uniref:YadA-like family protein n=1 Tax=Vibrio alfacsensis TaxID=1074311 RepID=UPI002ADE27FB|nr:YadA-like family protein [Vibrio alfacsensis]WQE78550.1 YadA-like family protein [Vibrio alfacsensis]